jgi:hypothetical protein
MIIRAKFRLDSVQQHGEEHTTVELRAVYSDDPAHENKQYWKYTPAGYVSMTVLSHVVKDWTVGQEYYVDFTLAEPVPS